MSTVSRPDTAVALAAAELEVHRGQTVLMLIPVLSRKLLKTAYAWGARNCEIHFAQRRGAYRPFDGVVIPTFMPETG